MKKLSKYDELMKLLASLNFEKDTKEYKILEAIINAVGELESDVIEQTCRVEEIDEDLANIEEEVYINDLSAHNLGDEEDEVFEFECPHCKAKIYIDEGILMQDKMNCPGCGKEVAFDLDLGEGGCGGCCSGCHGCE